MATKGEKIVTNLCGEIVTPRDNSVWPADWTDRRVGDNKGVGEVKAVYLSEGEIYCLVRDSFYGRMAVIKATDLCVESVRY